MEIALIVIGGLIVLAAALLLTLYFRMVICGRRRRSVLLGEINPVIAKLKAGEPPPIEQINEFVKRPETRSLMYRALHEIGQEELFPEEFRTLAHIAESDLVKWLLHPNELDAVPDAIELAATIERSADEPSQKSRFYVFKFRTLAPHWMAERGWVAGVAGPYWDDVDPVVSPPGVFSEFEPFSLRTPEEHLARIEPIVLRKTKWRI